MRCQTAATDAARTSKQSKFIGDGSDMMPAIGTPVAANTSLGASLTFTLPMSASARRYWMRYDTTPSYVNMKSDTARYNCKTAPISCLYCSNVIRIAWILMQVPKVYLCFVYRGICVL